MTTNKPLLKRQIRRRKLYEDVVEELEGLIHSGEYGPGARLPSEREVMEQFGVGRTAVREAMFALQKMGLIQVSSGERARVVEPTPSALVNELGGAARLFLSKPEGIRHFQDARLLFEGAVVRRTAVSASDEDIAVIEQALAANKADIGDGPAFERSDKAFHSAIFAAVANPIFTALDAALSEWLAEQRSVSARVGASPVKVYEDHERVFIAIRERDPDAAEKAMKDHLDHVADIYWQAPKAS